MLIIIALCIGYLIGWGVTDLHLRKLWAQEREHWQKIGEGRRWKLLRLREKFKWDSAGKVLALTGKVFEGDFCDDSEWYETTYGRKITSTAGETRL